MTNELIVPADGFDEASNGRVIQGELIKCTDGRWTDRDGLQPPTPLLVLAVNTVLQRWQGQRPVETIAKTPGKEFPNVDDLNAEIPENKWEAGPDGKPRAPWQLQNVVYLLNPKTAERFTFASGTIGARVAIDKLRDQVVFMRQLRGANVVPV